MFVVLSEGKLQDYKKSKLKPSQYCQQILGFKEIKSPEFIAEYFNDIDYLVSAVKLYSQKINVPKGEKSLATLLNSKHN